LIYLLFNYDKVICLGLWCLGFISFIMTIKRKHVKYQIRMFMTTHLILGLSTAPILLTSSIIYKGIIWIVLPQMMICANDAFAYLIGVTFGKTPLIKLSPNKTFEGFLGGIFGTILSVLVLTYFLLEKDYFICPEYNLKF